ncbi:hypothetical protein A3A95_04250 [Candidatus Nomurabacteria bacterium RIFCSPLOWO2_01_FULL_39_18]|uniref:Uncharacterized protein n=1 Tax=Candidatus Nomurabacteria bacterium RIFCSPHIGHO2_01_FULL_40_24b TaxID=1801739 RepID=A0A1F6V671_9BACT|nr:MAG: hypothetical protein A2647_04270 [Candidatus Nomurabacteria bacterium RIFCSPHIGHO2_01_FULL_40_24b]OGI89310.1 MAG: hypothetical protein A3A95_04250 [Candidatus Nomurabacteria bacterium RIFCSPLOWO2_01_FULL_39_18]
MFLSDTKIKETFRSFTKTVLASLVNMRKFLIIFTVLFTPIISHAFLSFNTPFSVDVLFFMVIGVLAPVYLVNFFTFHYLLLSTTLVVFYFLIGWWLDRRVGSMIWRIVLPLIILIRVYFNYQFWSLVFINIAGVVLTLWFLYWIGKRIDISRSKNIYKWILPIGYLFIGALLVLYTINFE